MADVKASDTPTNLADLESLEIPSLAPRALVREFGPGMILMMTGIGTSHLVTAPTAGGRFAYALLWCIPISYIFKYYGFEMAFRFTNATGKSLLDAYSTAWKKWPLWYVLITTLLQCAIGQAGRLIAAAAVLYYFFSEFLGLPIPFNAYGLVLGVIAVTIILRGKYGVIESSAKILAGILLVSTVAVYLVEPAPLSTMKFFVIFDMPDGSWLIVAAFLGLLPTGMDVSLQASEWGTAKRVGLSRVRPVMEAAGLAEPFDPFSSSREDLTIDTRSLSPHARLYCQRWFQIGLWDFRMGHVISFLIACMFLLLAAVWLYPSPIEGRGVMGEIAGIFTNSVGPGMMIVFIVGAFAATFSTALNYFDGWPRIVGACCRNLFQPTQDLKGLVDDDLTPEHRRSWYSEYNIYRITMLYSLITAVIFIALIPKPVFLVLVASALAFFVAPIIFLLNLYYCQTLIPKHDKVFHPSTFAKWFGWSSLFVFGAMSALLIWARVIYPLIESAGGGG